MAETVEIRNGELWVKIPKILAKKLCFSEGSEVLITIQNGCIVNSPKSTEHRLTELASQITPDNQHSLKIITWRTLCDSY